MQNWLIVDDEIADTFILRRAIKECGLDVKVHFFGTGRALLDHVARPDCEPFDIVLVDINMPELDGFDVLDQLRKLGMPPGAQLVMYSNTKNEQDSLLAYKRGAQGFVSKPSTFFEAKAIAEVLYNLSG